MSLPCEEIVHVKVKRQNIVFYLTLNNTTLNNTDNKTDLLDFAVERGKKIAIEGDDKEIRAYKTSIKGENLLEEFNKNHAEKLNNFFKLNDDEKIQLLRDLLEYADKKTTEKYHERIEKIKEKIAGNIKVEVVDAGEYCEGDEFDDDQYIPDDPYMYGDFPVPLDP